MVRRLTLVLCLMVGCAVDSAVGRARLERRRLAMCLNCYPEGARIQRRECVAAHPEGVDKFEADGRE